MKNWRERYVELRDEEISQGDLLDIIQEEMDLGELRCDYCEKAPSDTFIGDSYGIYGYCSDCSAIIEHQMAFSAQKLVEQGHFID